MLHSNNSDLPAAAHHPQATAPAGYWQLNMNQGCYEGRHLAKWTPIGVIMSVIIGLGVPALSFFPVYLNRQRLTQPDVQLRWGWLYMRFY